MNEASIINPTKKYSCAGIIIFRKKHKLETILVKTHKDNYSFPKGKLNKGETYIDGAIRETNEETGIVLEDIKLLSENGKYVYIEELSEKNNPSVLYFIGEYNKDNLTFSYDEEELKEVNWFQIDDVYKLNKIKQARKEVLDKAVNIYNRLK